jgi:hypothetical protein
MTSSSDKLKNTKLKNLYYNQQDRFKDGHAIKSTSEIVLARRKFKATTGAKNIERTVLNHNNYPNPIPVTVTPSYYTPPTPTPTETSGTVSMPKTFYKNNGEITGHYIEIVNKNSKQNLVIKATDTETRPYIIKIFGSDDRAAFKTTNNTVTEVSTQMLEYINNERLINLTGHIHPIYIYYRILDIEKDIKIDSFEFV